MKKPPFIVLSLPRSRSTWIASFLSYGGKTCGHDIASSVGTMAEFAALFDDRYAGTAETGAVVGWRAIRRVLPAARIAVVRRPVDQIYKEMAGFGCGVPAMMDELKERDAMLDQVAKLPGVLSVTFAELRGPAACQALFEHCLETPFDWEWWESLAHKDIQVDVAAEFQYVIDNADRIAALKRDALRVAGSDGVFVGPEAWETVWPEIDPIFAEHFGEVEGDLAAQRPYKLDEPAMRDAHARGQLRITTARVGGELAGYCMWLVTPDVESKGTLIAQHGPWFVKKQFAHLLLGPKLFDASVEDLRAIGVKVAFPHHRLQGRGAKLGKFFQRRGAVETQRTYSMWLGEAQHA
jgi:hypothetical protein